MRQLDLFGKDREAVFADIQPHVVEKFRKFHSENPQVYELFKRFCQSMRNAGRSQYGSKAVMERIRWHVMVETKDEDFKINNNYTSCYSRLLIYEDPSFAEFFQIRKSPGTVSGGGR